MYLNCSCSFFLYLYFLTTFLTGFYFFITGHWAPGLREKHIAAIKAGGGSYKNMPTKEAVKMAKASGGSYKGMPNDEHVKMAKASGAFYTGMPEIEKMKNLMSCGTGPQVQAALKLKVGKSTLRVKKLAYNGYPAIDCKVSVKYEPKIKGYVMVVDKKGLGFISVKGLCSHLWEKSGRSPNHSDSYKFVYLKNNKLFQQKMRDGSWNFN